MNFRPTFARGTAHQLLCVVALSPSVTFARERANHALPNAAREIAVLRAIAPNATLAQIKRILPRNTRYGKPQWVFGEGIFGNIITFHGPISGKLCFDSPQQRRDYPHPHNTGYSRNDPINWMKISMVGGSEKNIADGKRNLSILKRHLGWPDKTFLQTEEGGSSLTGYYATWKSPDRVILYDPNNDDAGPLRRWSTLTLEFPYTVH